MKIRLLTQNPFSVWFWGLEIQATKYIENIKKISPDMDIWFFDWTEKDFDVLHIVGLHSSVNPYWIDVLKARWIKIVVSSVFYVKPNSLFDFRRPIVYKIFSFIPFHIVNWMKQIVLKADIILPNSQDEAEQLSAIFWVNKNKIQVLHNGVDEKYFEWVDPMEFKNKHQLDDYFLCVSHIEPRKNHLSLIESFLELRQNNWISQKLVILGDYRWNYFAYHDKIRSLINSNPEVILHISTLKNSDSLFKSAYLWAKGHILLSSLETPGLSNIESMYAWLPLILGDCKPVREYFWEDAMYVDPKNKSEIQSVILKIIHFRLNKSAVEKVKERYTWEAISTKLNNIYHSI